MDNQDKQTEPPPSQNGRAEITQVGQVVRELANVTRPLPATQPPRRAAPPANSAQRERITTLVAALNDTEHPLHQQAVQQLITIGDPAVPALNEALSTRRPWLTAYRAAEALGQIGDGRATGALIEALRHPNSNVRWSAVRALAAIGDARALLELRRVARDDRGKTSWGETIAGTAQSALDQMRSQNVLLRGADLVKTALACVLMLVALIVAWSVVTSLRAELSRVGHEPVAAAAAAPLVTVAPTVAPSQAQGGAPAGSASAATSALDQPTAVPPATAGSSDLSGNVLATANVRTAPSSKTGEKLGTVSTGDEIVFLARTSDGTWYRVRLGEKHGASSQISSADGSGWVIGTLLSFPNGDVPVEQAAPPAATPKP